MKKTPRRKAKATVELPEIPYDLRDEWAAALDKPKVEEEERQGESLTTGHGLKVNSTSEEEGGRKKRVRKKVWLKSEEDALIDAAKSLVYEGMRSQGGFKPGFLISCAERIVRKVKGSTITAIPHVKSKLHVWKKTYDLLCDFMGMSGVSVDPTTYQVVVEDESLWDGIIRANLYFKGLRGKPFPLYDDWCEIFGKDRATGGYARDSGDIGDLEDEKAKEDEDEDMRVSDEPMEAVPRPTRNKGKCPMLAEDEKARCYSEIRTYVHTLHTLVDPPLDIARRIMEELRPYDKFDVWTRSTVASYLLDHVSARQMWMILEDDTREDWLTHLVEKIYRAN